MKKLSIILLSSALLFASCKKDIQTLNEEIKKPADVPPSSLFANGQKNLMDIMTSSNVNRNVFRLVSQYWTECTYVDETNYDFATRNIPQFFWNTLYRDVLKNIDEAQKLVPLQDPLIASAIVKKNQQAIAEILKAYTYYIIVNTYGDAPYSQALDVSNVSPKYDDAQTICLSLVDKLDAAIANLNTTEGSYAESDMFYNGDVAKWATLANSLKLKIGILLSDVNPAKAKTIIESAAPKAMKSNADNAVIAYKPAPPNTNPIWVDLVQSGRKDFVAAAPIVHLVNSLGDPRIDMFFSKDANDGYSGGVVGKANTFSLFSKPSDKILKPDFEALLMDYAEVEFILAEAVERGFNVGGTAESHYNNAVTASILYWGGAISEATAYLAKSTVNYATAAGTYKQKIGVQKWIALYNRGFDGWVEINRLDFPKLEPPIEARSGFPARLTYPVQEQNLNTKNHKSASSAIGGDKVETKLFWDKF